MSLGPIHLLIACVLLVFFAGLILGWVARDHKEVFVQYLVDRRKDERERRAKKRKDPRSEPQKGASAAASGLNRLSTGPHKQPGFTPSDARSRLDHSHGGATTPSDPSSLFHGYELRSGSVGRPAPHQDAGSGATAEAGSTKRERLHPEPHPEARPPEIDRTFLVTHWQSGLEEGQGSVETVFAGLIQALGSSARLESIVSDGGRRVALKIHVGRETWIVPDFQTRLLELEKWFDIAAGGTRSAWISTLHQPALEQGDNLQRGVVS